MYIYPSRNLNLHTNVQWKFFVWLHGPGRRHTSVNSLPVKTIFFSIINASCCTKTSMTCHLLVWDSCSMLEHAATKTHGMKYLFYLIQELTSIEWISPILGHLAGMCYLVVLWWLFPRLRGFLGECSTTHSPPAFSCLFVFCWFFFFFFFELEISLHTLIPLFRPESVHSGSVNYGWMLPGNLRVSSFPDRFLHHAWTAA